MAQPQKNAMLMDNKQDSPEWVVIADDWVEVDGDEFDEAKSSNDKLRDHVKSDQDKSRIESHDHVKFDQDKSRIESHDHVKSDQDKSRIESHDHVTPPATAEIKNNSGPNENSSVLTRYVDVPEELVKFFTGKEVVMDLQIASGAMIQLTKAYDVDAKYRPVRLIGNSENVDKAEKLIKAVVALADAGGTVLLRKNDCDSYDYGSSKYGHQESYQSHNYSLRHPGSPLYPESWGPFQFDRKHSHKRSHGRR